MFSLFVTVELLGMTSDAFSQKEYSKMREPLMNKIAALIEKIEKLQD
jgi:hypothetical protein